MLAGPLYVAVLIFVAWFCFNVPGWEWFGWFIVAGFAWVIWMLVMFFRSMRR